MIATSELANPRAFMALQSQIDCCSPECFVCSVFACLYESHVLVLGVLNVPRV